MNYVYKVLILGLFFAWVPETYANPTGSSVTSGTITFASPATNRLVVTQTTPTAIINWNSFSINAGEFTRFIQPDTNSVVLNRVTGGNSTTIEGKLSANGQVYLINQNGILVGKMGVINTAGFIASTRDMGDTDFLSGNLHFTGSNSNGLKNLGLITVMGGHAILIGKTVDNEGKIKSKNGTAGLVAGDDVLLGQTNFDGSTIVVNANLSASSSTGTAITNGGTISALAAELKVANGNVYALAIKNTGTVTAQATSFVAGHVYLTTDYGVINTGKLTASANHATGGLIKIDADSIKVTNALTATRGTLTLNATGTITPNQNGSISVGNFILENGNWVEEVGMNGLICLPHFSATKDFELQNGSTFLRVLGGDGSTGNPFQLTDVYGLQGVGTYLNNSFVLNNNINAAETESWNQGAGFNPIGGMGGFNNPYTGTFDGHKHTISGLTIDRSDSNSVGLFGFTQGATLENVGLIGGKVSGYYVGDLVGGAFQSTISNCYTTGQVSGSSNSYYLGGMIGLVENSTITNCYASGAVSGSQDIGGLVGVASGSNITNCYATGEVNGSQRVGGLIGDFESSTLENCYATGAVRGSSNSYFVGGLVGITFGGTLTNCYWLQQAKINSGLYGVGYVSDNGGAPSNAGALPETLAQLQLQSTFNGWDFTAGTGPWAINSKLNGGLPYLQSLPVK